jgi:hypothetical protein
MPDQVGQIRALESASQIAAKDLVAAELTLGLTLCKLARRSHHDDNTRFRYRALARQAHAFACKYLWNARARPEFEQLMARAEFLKFELESTEPQDSVD